MAALSVGNHGCDLLNMRIEKSTNQPEEYSPADPENRKNGHCCGANGICNHEVLRNGELSSDSESINKRMLKKVVS